MTREALAHMIDQTLLKPSAPESAIVQLCTEAVINQFATVAILPYHVSLASSLLQHSSVGITAALSYPHGNWSVELKCKEIQDAVSNGASDCDMVINIGALRDGDSHILQKEADSCRKAAGSAILKVILEVALLTDDQIKQASILYAEAGFDFIKTSTGYLRPPTIDQISLMVQAVKPYQTRVKAAGGISNLNQAEAVIAAGADRIGTSAGINILKEFDCRKATGVL